MVLKLRTRLFLVVAILLGASIAVSALLSRRATLVEVRAVIEKDPADDDPSAVLERAGAAVASVPAGELSAALAAIAEDTSRRLVVGESGGRLVAASDPALMNARVTALTADGTFLAELGDGLTQSAVRVRGAPVRRVGGTDGRELLLLALPPLNDDERPRIPSGAPLWVWTTLATGIIAVPLVFAVGKRILKPITALTDAARQLQSGRLDVRVDARGGDELAELARTFNAMASRLAETERQRKQMVADIAHELRSPVTNLRCTLESIQDGLVAADRGSIDALHEEAKLLQRLIDDLQELTLAESGQLALRHDPVELAGVLRRVVAGLTRAGGSASVQMDLADSLPSITGDTDRLEQVFRNLVENAKTNTPVEGRIDVRARAEGDFVRVDVADTGSGIAAAHLPHVFDRFYRADGSRSRATGGAGLGLAIVRQLVTAHGGRVFAHSDGRGRGATFSVLLPIRS